MEDPVLAIVVIALVVLVIALIVSSTRHSQLRAEFEEQVRQKVEARFEGRIDKLVEDRAQEVAAQMEPGIRKDAIHRSQAVITGKTMEHFLPFLPEFSFNPRDARFLGSPVDLIIFDGLSEGAVRQVIFLEVKTGKTPTLTPREKSVRDTIEARSVIYEVVHAAP